MNDFVIAQGSNSSLIIEYPESVADSIDIHVGLYSKNGTELCHWTKETLTITDDKVMCKLTQDVTNEIPAGICYIETKRTTPNGMVRLYKKVAGNVLGRFDHHVIRETVETEVSENV